MSTTVTDQTPSPTADAHAATCARAALVTADAGRQEPFGDLVEVEELPDGRPPSGSEHLILRGCDPGPGPQWPSQRRIGAGEPVRRRGRVVEGIRAQVSDRSNRWVTDLVRYPRRSV